VILSPAYNYATPSAATLRTGLIKIFKGDK